MRLKLLAIPAFLFIITCRAMADVTVCASGCNVTTMTGAQQTATATPNSVLRIKDDSITAEQLTVGVVNTSLTIEGEGHSWGAPATASYALNVTNAMVATFVCNDVVFNRSVTEAGALNRLVLFSPGALGVATLRRCGFNVPASVVNTGAVANAGLATSSILIDRCYGTANGGAVLNFALAQAGSAVVKHGRFRSDFSAVRSVAAAPVSFLYCDFVNSAKGIIETTPNVITNCIFSGNTTDRDITGTGATTDFTYCAYTNSNADPGTGSITITAARTFCDVNNFFISPNSLTFNAGVSIDGVTGVDIGLNNVRQGAPGILGMGCNPYSLAMCAGYNSGK